MSQEKTTCEKNGAIPENLHEKLARIARENPTLVEIPAEPQPPFQYPTPSKAPTFGADDWTGFNFLPSFRESFDCLVLSGHIDLAYKFLETVVIYGTEGVDITEDPLVAVAMAQARPVIDKYRDKYKTGKKGKKAQ